MKRLLILNAVSHAKACFGYGDVFGTLGQFVSSDAASDGEVESIQFFFEGETFLQAG